MLRPIKAYLGGSEQFHLICIHWRSFPPVGAKGDLGIEELRRTKKVTEAEYSRCKVWQRICGKLWMSPDWCGTCEHVRKIVSVDCNDVMMRLDGTGPVTPLVDLPTLSLRSRKMGHPGLLSKPGRIPRNQRQACAPVCRTEEEK